MTTARINGINLYYEEHGEGQPLILSHGIGSNHLHWWQQIPVLSKHFRVITFDHRGFGFSKDLNNLGPKSFADDFDALLSHLEIDKVILCGQSMGGVTVGSYVRTTRREMRCYRWLRLSRSVWASWSAVMSSSRWCSRGLALGGSWCRLCRQATTRSRKAHSCWWHSH